MVIVGYHRVLWISGHVHHLTRVQQLRRKHGEGTVALDEARWAVGARPRHLQGEPHGAWQVPRPARQDVPHHASASRVGAEKAGCHLKEVPAVGHQVCFCSLKVAVICNQPHHFLRPGSATFGHCYHPRVTWIHRIVVHSLQPTHWIFRVEVVVASYRHAASGQSDRLDPPQPLVSSLVAVNNLVRIPR